MWKQILKAANEIARNADREAKAQMAARCEALGIPARFAPGVSVYAGWNERGENMVAKRRVELRHVAVSRIAALEKAAHVAIERQALEIQTRLLAGGLSSPEARAFLESLPSADALMPPVALAELEAGMASRKEITS